MYLYQHDVVDDDAFEIWFSKRADFPDQDATFAKVSFNFFYSSLILADHRNLLGRQIYRVAR